MLLFSFVAGIFCYVIVVKSVTLHPYYQRNYTLKDDFAWERCLFIVTTVVVDFSVLSVSDLLDGGYLGFIIVHIFT